MRADLKALAKVIRTVTHSRAPAETASALRLAEKLHDQTFEHLLSDQRAHQAVEPDGKLGHAQSKPRPLDDWAAPEPASGTRTFPVKHV